MEPHGLMPGRRLCQKGEGLSLLIPGATSIAVDAIAGSMPPPLCKG